MKPKPVATKKQIGPELRKTLEKIRAYTTDRTPDSDERILSAVGTQYFLTFSIQAIEARPSEAGKRRRGYRAPLRVAIEHICSGLQTPNLESVLQELENNDAIDDMYSSLTNPIDIHAVEVFRDEEKVSFSLRNGGSKTVTFKTIRNLIAGYTTYRPD